jgi:serine/threonine protein kinase
LIGTRLDARYRVLSKLGEGAIGEVYLAEHIHLERKEALKVLRPALATDPEFVARFRREARATNRVQHANIVSVHDFGRSPDGRFYLSMEYAEGERLDRLLRRLGTLPVSRVLPILVQIADAIHHAHDRGVVHRDLKPENIILVEHRGHPDFVKILDFGFAKIVAPGHAESADLSGPGRIFGTPAYMPPEQADGSDVDGRSDIYAVGCIAFELLVGEPPFLGSSAIRLVHAHKSQSPDLPSRRTPQAAIPQALDDIVMRCLAKRPDHRFQTGRDLSAALRAVPGYRGGGSSGSSRRSRRLPRPIDYLAAPDTEDRSSAPTGIESSGVDERIAPETRGVLLDAAEALIDLGASDPRLIAGAARLRDLHDKLRREDAEIDTLESRLADLDQTTREREGSIRFALGELLFARSQGAREAAELDTQIDALERRLAEVRAELAAEEAALLDRLIALTATRDTTVDELVASYDPMAALIEPMLERQTAKLPRVPALDALLARLRDANARRRRDR